MLDVARPSLCVVQWLQICVSDLESRGWLIGENPYHYSMIRKFRRTPQTLMLTSLLAAGLVDQSILESAPTPPLQLA